MSNGKKWIIRIVAASYYLVLVLLVELFPGRVMTGIAMFFMVAPLLALFCLPFFSFFHDLRSSDKLVDKGMRALEDGLPEKGRKYLLAAADLGSMRAMKTLGDLFRLGQHDADPDEEAALDWYEKTLDRWLFLQRPSLGVNLNLRDIKLLFNRKRKLEAGKPIADEVIGLLRDDFAPDNLRAVAILAKLCHAGAMSGPGEAAGFSSVFREGRQWLPLDQHLEAGNRSADGN